MRDRIAALFCLTLLAGAVALSTAAPASAATCNIRGKERKLGPTYVTSLRVSGTSCATGERVVKAFHKCRFANGGKDGRCRTRVLRWRCTEKRLNRISTQYDARVTCTKGSASIKHNYTQFT